MKMTTYDVLPLTELTYATRAAIVAYWREQDWDEIDTDSFIQPEWAALMWFRLRQAPDHIFPRGKWATLQHLESLIDKMVLADMKNKERENPMSAENETHLPYKAGNP